MQPIHPHKTSTFRLTLFAAALFALSGILVLGFVYWRVLENVDVRIGGIITRDSADFADVYRRAGAAGLTEAVSYRMSDRAGAVRLYLMVDPAGRLLAGNLAGWPADAPGVGEGTKDLADLRPLQGAPLPARVQVIGFPDGLRLLVGYDLGGRDNVRRILRQAIAGGVILMTVLGVAAGLLVARQVLARLEAIGGTAETILGGDLDGRVPRDGSDDEFDRLAATLNRMLDRIQRLLATVRGVTQNIAHDLRSPLNRLRSRLEVTVMTPRRPEEYQEAILRAIAETDAIMATFSAMLRIARIEGRGERRPGESIDLDGVVEAVVDFYLTLAEEKEITLRAEANEGVMAIGDAELLSQALINLLDNAVKYTPAGGEIVVVAATSGGRPRLEVRDNGPGIPAERRAEVLQPFARIDSSRNTPGIGLGLSLVAAIADHHGAQLTLEDNHPGLKAIFAFPPP